MSTPDPYALPEWMLDAWAAGINTSKYDSDEHIIERIERALRDKRSRSVNSWSMWTTAALMSMLGWRQVLAARDEGTARRAPASRAQDHPVDGEA